MLTVRYRNAMSALPPKSGHRNANKCLLWGQKRTRRQVCAIPPKADSVGDAGISFDVGFTPIADIERRGQRIMKRRAQGAPRVCRSSRHAIAQLGPAARS